MSGRPKQSLFVYNLDGTYREAFYSKNDFRRQYFPDDKGPRPILCNSERLTTKRLNNELITYSVHKDFIIFDQRVYRDDIVFLLEIHFSEFCKKSDKVEEIEVLNIKQEVIATVKNFRLLSKLFPHISMGTMHSQLNNPPSLKSNTKSYSKSGLFFRYKPTN
jgi:hypothetical protein